MNLLDKLKQQKATSTASTSPVTTTTPPVTTTTPPVTTAQAPPSISSLNGGNMLNTVMDALKTATVGSSKNDNIPLGKGIYLLKSGKYIVAQSGAKLTSLSFICLKSLSDSNGIPLGTEGYSGPIPGETYNYALFHNLAPKNIKYTMNRNATALSACMGWPKEKYTEYLTTEEGTQKIVELLKALLCVDLTTDQPTNQPCMFSNQVVLEISAKIGTGDEKSSDGSPSYDENGNVKKKTYINVYLDRKVPIQEAIGLVGDDDLIIRAFGTQEAIMQAIKVEAELSAM